MRLSAVTASGLLLISACAAMPQASLENRTLAYGCSDIVAVGSVTNRAYEPVGNNGDLIGHGWISATLHVRRTIRGATLPAALPVRYLAHTNMRQDRDFMLVLKRGGAGYEIAAGQLMSARPLLASHCS
jgi:integration host factor subunit beta